MTDKIVLRLGHLPPGDLRVLDCFAGSGVIWQTIMARSAGRRIQVLPIDTRVSPDFHLTGDNRRFLVELDLDRFDVIDLDAWGVPFDQLEIIFARAYRGVVFVTFNRNVAGILPYGMLEAVGFTRAQLEKCPTLLVKRGWTLFCEYLARRGVQRIAYRSDGTRHTYLTFDLSDVARRAAGWDSLPVGTAASLS